MRRACRDGLAAHTAKGVFGVFVTRQEIGGGIVGLDGFLCATLSFVELTQNVISVVGFGIVLEAALDHFDGFVVSALVDQRDPEVVHRFCGRGGYLSSFA